MVKIDLTKAEIEQIVFLIKEEKENGKRAMVENYKATLLIEEWRKTILIYDRLLNKLGVKDE